MNEEDLDDSFQLLLEDNYELKTDSGSKSKSEPSGVSSVVSETIEIVTAPTVDFPTTPLEPLDLLIPVIPSLVIPKPHTQPENPSIQDESPVMVPLTRLSRALSRFYAVYNPENVSKASTVAAKFTDRRPELWEQLSIKYFLSVSASSKLFIELFIDAQPAISSYLFNCPPLFIRDDSLALRAANWRGLLGLSDEEMGKKRELYSSFLKDAIEVDEAIMRDVSRTHQENAFFHDSGNQKSLKNVLAVFTVVNGVPYVQGMNEVAAILLFTTRSEPDAFWLFNEMMAQLREVFIPGSDSTHDGVYSQIELLRRRLEQLNPSLHRHLISLGFPIETVCLKWITTLLSMELTIPDTLKLWDTLLMSLRSNTLREMSSSVVLGYMACMQDHLLEQIDLEECMSLVSTFGRGLNLNIDVLVLQVLANYAFETKLRGKYTPTEISVILEKITDAVQVAKEGLLTFWDNFNALE